MARWVGLVLGCLVLATLIQPSYSDCASPINRIAMYSCASTDLSFLQTYYPDNWWANGNPYYMGPMEYLQQYWPCCQYCVWSLDYPKSVPIVSLYGPILNCAQFDTDYQGYDRNHDERLSRTEFQAYLNSPLNSILVAKQYLDPDYFFFQGDLDRNGFISEGEFLALRHFWAAAELTQTGPTIFSGSSTVTTMAAGRLGGAYLDKGQVQLWFTAASSLTSNAYSNRQSSGWDPQQIRDATSHELTDAFARMDLDGSQVVSFEEHYFRVFADINGDGWLSVQEYYLSLYKNVNDAGEQDNQYLYPINFNIHDWNRDGRVSFLERKFVASDINNDQVLSSSEWMRGDYPENFMSDGQDITGLKYFYFIMLQDCTSIGSWAPQCLLDVRFENFPPFAAAELAPTPAAHPGANVTEAEGSTCQGDADCSHGRACSYFGYCVDEAALMPTGQVERYRNWKVPPNGLAVDTWAEVARTLNYNYTWTLMDSVTLQNAQAPTTKVAMPTVPITLLTSIKQRYTQADNIYIDPSPYMCSAGMWASDGIALVTRSNPIVVSSQLALAYVMISPSFINFVALFLLLNMVLGHIFWFAERKKNPEHFHPSYFLGVIDGLWFSMVTVTTVGYGDKVPKSGLGRLVTGFYMLLGLIAFSVLGGQAISGLSQIYVMYQVQTINDVNGNKAGVLGNFRPAQLAAYFGFTPVECGSVGACAQAVLDKQLNGVLVPNNELRNYFLTSPSVNTTCGNPLTSLGSPLLNGDPIFGNMVAVCMCETCNLINNTQVPGTLVYPASYLQNQINSVLAGLSQSGFLAAADQAVESLDIKYHCQSPTQFDLNSIVACLVVVFVVAVVITVQQWGRAKPLRDALTRLLAPVQRGATKVVSFGISWRQGSRSTMAVSDDEDMDDDDDDDEDDDETDPAAALARRRNRAVRRDFGGLKLTCNKQLDRITKVEGEVMLARRRLLRVSRMLLMFGVGALVAFTAGVAALVMVWGTQVKPSALGLPDSASLLSISSPTEL